MTSHRSSETSEDEVSTGFPTAGDAWPMRCPVRENLLARLSGHRLTSMDTPRPQISHNGSAAALNGRSVRPRGRAGPTTWISELRRIDDA